MIFERTTKNFFTVDVSVFAKKLKLDSAKRNLIVNAPAEYITAINGIAFDTKPGKKHAGQYDFVQVFATKQEELEKLCKIVESAGKYDCLFWAC